MNDKLVNYCSNTKSKPLISIITVTYNAVNSVDTTIRNILNQTYKWYELVIIDGGSTDGTVQIIQEYNDKLSYWISENDNGVYDAMNKGISHSHGDWVIFMNSGDLFATNSVLEDVFSKNKIKSYISILYGNTIVKNTSKIIIPPAALKKGFFHFETICHQSIFFRREAFNTIGYFNTQFKIVADRAWLLKSSIMKLPSQYLPINICIWDQNGFSTRNSVLSIKENLLLQRFYFNPFERFLLPWIQRYKNFRNKLNIGRKKG